MKRDTTMRDGIEAALAVLTRLLEDALADVRQSYTHIRRNEQNMAIGAIIPAEAALDRATALYKAIVAMHCFEHIRREPDAD